MVWGWDKAPQNWPKLLGMLNRFKLTTSLPSSMSSTVLSSWTQASRSGLLELSSSCPLNWSMIRGNKTSLQSKSTRENMRGVDDTQLLVRVDEKNDMLTWTAVKSYLAVWTGYSLQFSPDSPASASPSENVGCFQWTSPAEHCERKKGFPQKHKVENINELHSTENTSQKRRIRKQWHKCLTRVWTSEIHYYTPYTGLQTVDVYKPVRDVKIYSTKDLL